MIGSAWMGYKNYSSFPSSWARQCQITLNNSLVSSAQSNFPWALIQNAFPSEFWTYIQAGGGDIRFTTDEAGTEPLYFEIETINKAANTIAVWVNIPSLLTTTQTIWVWYGNSAAQVPVPNDHQFGSYNVWDSGYQGVFHLPNGTTLTAKDSTSHGNNGTLGGSAGLPTATTGQIDGGMNCAKGTYVHSGAASAYSGAGYVSVPIANFSGSSGFSGYGTIEWWMYPNFSPTDGQTDPFWGQIAGTTTPELDAQKFNDNKLYIGWNLSGSDDRVTVAANGILSQSTWQHWAFVWNSGAKATLYVDGVLKGTASNNTTTTNVNSDFLIGRQGVGQDFGLNGDIDEFRISSTNRPVNWFLTSYNNQSNLSTSGTPGTPQTP